MRIIGGLARGIQLKSPHEGHGIKPTMDRVREAVFNSLEPIMGLTVVDLFACSGALGLEACSRQADRVAWFEHKRSLCKIIEENISRVANCLGEAMPEHRLMKADVLMAPKLLMDWKPDLILADPPYNPDANQKGAFDILKDEGLAEWASNALLVMEQPRQRPLDPRTLKLWKLTRQRVYGNQIVYFLRVV